MADEKPWGCSYCKKRFADAYAVREHHKQKHKGKRIDPKVTAAIRALKDDDDESFASRTLNAELDRAMGVDNPDYDWLVEPYK